MSGDMNNSCHADPQPTVSSTEFAKTFPKIAALVAHGTRCGKPSCRCMQGQLHPTHYLRWREGSVQRRRYVRARDVPAVRAILAQRREERRLARWVFAQSLQSWRDRARWLAEVEAHVRAEQENA